MTLLNQLNKGAQEGLTSSHITLLLQQLTTGFKRRFFIEQSSQALPVLLSISFIVYLLMLEQPNAFIFALVVFGLTSSIAYLYLIKSARYRAINDENILFHLNRQFPQLNESAQLVIKKREQLNVLQQLQQQRVLITLAHIVKSSEEIVPKAKVKSAFLYSCLIVILFSFTLHLLTNSALLEKQNLPVVNEQLTERSQAKILLQSRQVSIDAPAYTQQASVDSDSLDISLIEGSLVTWRLTFSHPKLSYKLIFSDGLEVALEKQTNGDFIAQHNIKHTSLYKIVSMDQAFTSVHTLTVTQDTAPKIRIITPKSTISEIAKNAIPRFNTQVSISDDFALSKVEILASIAKGSGESVKFRDQTFSFDNEKQGDKADLYTKQWRLDELGMAPGDELYFTVKAWDNKTPKTQLTRSSTKIIRWLEDEEQGVLSSGVLIDFMPEYFKSQRQIIIETLELIDDKKQLTPEKFAETSELLGVAQSSLKERYGQYLGDEVESGNLENAAISHDVHHDDEHAHEDEHEENHEDGHEEEHGNDHAEQPVELAESHHHHETASDSFEMKNFGTDRSGYTEQRARFGHNHGDADIGIINKEDPKALMKRSIANMWQAESHLMLSEPDKALPYEQQALKFLNMAKKAERIYVKRLGFEPPPVSEQRRYQGELDEILSYQKEEDILLPPSDNQILSTFFQMLNQTDKRESIHVDNKGNNGLTDNVNSYSASLSKQQQDSLNAAKEVISKLINKRPSLITALGTIEKISLANSLQITDCQQCIFHLKSKLWQLITPQLSQPTTPQSNYFDGNTLLQHYGEYLEQAK